MSLVEGPGGFYSLNCQQISWHCHLTVICTKSTIVWTHFLWNSWVAFLIVEKELLVKRNSQKPDLFLLGELDREVLEECMLQQLITRPPLARVLNIIIRISTFSFMVSVRHRWQRQQEGELKKVVWIFLSKNIELHMYLKTCTVLALSKHLWMKSTPSLPRSLSNTHC